MMTLADMLLGRPVTLPDGRTVDLKQRAYNAKSLERHREEINARKRARYAAKREEISARRRAQYAADAEKRKRTAERNRQWAQDNPERMRALRDAYERRRKAPGIEKTRRYMRRWRESPRPDVYLARLKSGDVNQRRAARWIVHGEP